jgi:predicted RNA-binding protein with PIN domain
MDVLLVDGYNIIGAWPDLRALREHDLAGARDLLIEKMAEYQAYTGYKVMIIFDAYFVPGLEKKFKNFRVEIMFTRENETADERIEKLVKELKNIRTQIYVATSDYLEQSVTFGQGALRKSARELYIEMGKIENNISKQISKFHRKKQSLTIPISDEIAEIFEKWRRGK